VLQIWYLSKRCQAKPLLLNLFDRVTTDHLSRPILLRLLGSKPLLAAALEDHPLQFNSLCKSLQEDLQTTSGDARQYGGLIRQSDLEPLASFQSYVELVEAILARSRNDSDSDFKSLHSFFSSASPRLLSCLSETTIRHARDQWRIEIASSLPTRALLAIHVACNIKRYQAAPAGGHSKHLEKLDGTLVQWARKCSSLFEGARASSIVDTTLLTSLKLCSEEDVSTLTETLQMVDVAADILNALSCQSRREWAQKHSTAVRKLIQKANRLRLPIDLAIRNSVFNLLTTLSHEYQFHEWIPFLRSNIEYLSQPLSALPLRCTGDALKTSWKCALRAMEAALVSVRHQSQMDLDITMATLVQLVTTGEMSSKEPCVNDMMRLFTAHLVLEMLDSSSSIETMDLSKSVVQSCAATIKAWPVISLPVSQSTCNGDTTCHRTYQLCRQSLCKQLSKFVLRISSTQGIRLDPLDFNAICTPLDQRSDVIAPSCQYAQSENSSRAQRLTRNSAISPSSWRESLQAQLVGPLEQSVGVVEQLLYDITHDLQSRCENVEAPLREAQRTIVALEGQNRQLQEDLSRNNKRLLDTQGWLSEQEEKANKQALLIAEMSRDSTSIQSRFQQALTDLETVTERLELDRKEHEVKLQQVRLEAHEEAAEHRMASDLRVSEHQDQIAALRSSISTLQHQNEWVTKEMKQCITECEAQWQERTLQLENDHGKEKTVLNTGLSQLRKDLAGKESEMEYLTSQLSDTKDQVRQLNETNNRLDERAEDAERAVERPTKDIAAYETEKRVTHERIQEMDRDHSVTQELLHNQNQTISNLEVSEAALRAKCKAQEKALAKARRAEKSVLAILQRNSHHSESSPLPVRPATSELAGTPTPRPPVGSFVSEDDEDFAELVDIGEDM
jgi:hypothetical protein